MILKVITDTRAYNAAMKHLTREQLPRAQVATINAVARVVNSAQGTNIKKDFVLRNQYTMRSLKISEAKVRSSGAVGYAEVGSISPYLPLQEEGGQRRPVRGHKVPLPTMASRGGNWSRPILPRFRLGTGTMKRSMFILHPGTGAGNRKQILNRPGQKYGKYRLTHSAIFMRQGKKLYKIRLLNEPSYRVKPTHWHTAAVKKFGTRHLMETVFVREARKIIGATG